MIINRYESQMSTWLYQCGLRSGEIFKETNAGISWNKLRFSKNWDLMNNLNNFPQNVLSKLSWHVLTLETGDEYLIYFLLNILRQAWQTSTWKIGINEYSDNNIYLLKNRCYKDQNVSSDTKQKTLVLNSSNAVYGLWFLLNDVCCLVESKKIIKVKREGFKVGKNVWKLPDLSYIADGGGEVRGKFPYILVVANGL